MISRISIAAGAALFMLAAAVPAQEAAGQTDAERLKAAKQEQRDLRAKEKEAKRAEARAAADAEEQERLKKLGLTDAEQPPEEKKGFFLQLEAAYTEVEGAERTVANSYAIESAATTAEELDTDGDGLPDAFTRGAGEKLQLTYDGQASPRVEVGWRMDQKGAFSLRWTSFSADSSVSASSSRRFASADPAQGDLVLGGIDMPGLAATQANYDASPEAFDRAFGSPLQLIHQGLHGADSLTASGKLETTRLDFLYSRTALARKRVEASFQLGLTQLEAKRDEEAVTQWTSFSRGQVLNDRRSVETISTSCETSGLGVSVGVAGRWGLTANRRWSLRAGLDLAGVQASQKLRFVNSQVTSQTGLPDQAPEVYQDVKDEDASQFVSLAEGDVAIEGRWGQRMRLALGYRYGKWFNALTNERYPSASNAALLTSESVDLTAQGPYLRFGIFF